MKILLLGNCQLLHTRALIQQVLGSGLDVNAISVQALARFPEEKVMDALSRFKIIVTNVSPESFNAPKEVSVLQVPDLQFSGYHPDQTYISSSDDPDFEIRFLRATPASGLGFWCYMRGMNADQATGFFTERIFERMGYFERYALALKVLEARFKELEFDFSPTFRVLNSHDVPMLTAWHPKADFSAILADSYLEKLELRMAMRPSEATNQVADSLSFESCWSCFPPVAEFLGVPGSWLIRHGGTVFSGINGYLRTYYDFLDSNYEKSKLQFHARDSQLFSLENYDRALGDLV